jgi:transporter family protein
MWKYYAILSAVFAALTAILAKIGMKGVSGNLATAIRTVIILFMAWGVVVVTGELRSVKELTRGNWFFLILSGVATGLSWIFYFKALETGEVSRVASIDKLSIALTIGLSFLILKEPMDWKILLGGLLIVVGTVIIVI